MLRAGGGRMPNPDRSAVRHRGKSEKTWRTVEDTPYLEGRERELPPLPRGKGLWHARTRAWWDSVRTMPHCRLWSESDWEFAAATALVFQAFWLGGDVKMEAPLRMRERLMGCTEESRVAGGIKYLAPDEAPLAEVSQIVFMPDGSIKKPKTASPRSRVRAVDPDGMS